MKYQTLLNQALDFHKHGKLDEAECIYLEILKISKDLKTKSYIYNLLGDVNFKKKKYSISKKYLTSSLKINYKDPHALNSLGILEKKINNKSKAKFFFKKNIKHNNFFESYTNVIEICISNYEFEEAKQLCLEALKKFPENDIIQSAFAFLLYEQGKIEESIALFEKIMNKASPNPRSIYNYAIILMRVGNLKKSLYLTNNLFYLLKKNTDLFLLRHQILKKLGNFADAEKDLLSALDFDRSNYKVKNSLILLYLDLKKYQEVNSYCSKFLKSEKKKNNINFFKSAIFIADLYLANWKNFYQYYNEFNKNQINFNEIFKPLEICYIENDPQKILDFTKYYWEKYLKQVNIKLEVNRNTNNNLKNKKIKIGFFSGDYGEHAVTHLIKDLFLNFDKSKFEIHGYSLYKRNDTYRSEVKASFIKFFDLDKLNNQEILDLVLKNDLDVAIDLSGYTKHKKSWLFSFQIAKIKINYLGYPGTMGSHFYDYLIADKYIIPDNYKKFYSEKIIYLPETYQPFSLKSIEKKKFCREDFDLPKNTILIASFSRVEKILPNIFEIWMKIIALFENVKLVLNISDNQTILNIQEFCKLKNFYFDRIIFVKKIEHLEHLHRLGMFDLYLDTYPYNSHTVLSDALFQATLPAVSLVGNSFQSRVSSSLLHYANLEECITYNYKEYENKIFELIQNNNLLSNLKLKLEKRRSVLSDRMVKFTRDFENTIIDILDV